MKLVMHVTHLYPRNDCIHCCYYIGNRRYSKTCYHHSTMCTHNNYSFPSIVSGMCLFKKISALERLL